MALVLADRVRETTTTTGTGAVTLGGAYTGFQTFSAGIGNGNTTYYTIANVVTGEWEVGIGTYTSASNTLSRDTVLASSNANALVNFVAGSKDVFVTQPAERAVYINSANTQVSVPQLAATSIVVDSSSGDALRITQTGTGNALVVEDEANPDSTPFVVNSNGAVGIQTSPNGNDYLAIGSAGTQPTALTATTVDGIGLRYDAPITATNVQRGLYVAINGGNSGSAYTTSTFYGNQVNNYVTGTNQSLTNLYGFYCNSQTAGTNNYGFHSNIAASSVTAGSFVVGTSYKITSIGTTDFTLIGASSNTVGTVFTATGAGTGTGTANVNGRWNFFANGTAENVFNGNTIISVNSGLDALRITQTGAGNALLVEDSANPDSTPTVIDSTGRLVVGNTESVGAGQNTNIQSLATSGTAGVSAFRFSNDTTPPRLQVGKSRSTTIGSYTIVQNGDQLGGLYFYGDDGTDLVSQAASILGEVDGTPGTNDMPGRLVFSTTADGASTPTERMRINNAGNVGIGTASPGAKLHVQGGNTILNSAPVGNNYVFVGQSASYLSAYGENPLVQISQLRGTSYGNPLALYTWGNDTVGAELTLGKSRGTAVGTQTILQNGDAIGVISFAGSDGTNMNQVAADITAYVSGVPGATADMPGALAFRTTSDGAGSPTERVRIDSSGNVGIGTNSPVAALSVAKQITALSGTSQPYGLHIYPTSSGLCYIDALTSSTSNTSLGLRTYNNGTYNEVRIDSSGNVGIGKTPVGAMLDVNGAVKAGNGTAAATSYSFQGSSAIGMFTPDAGFSVAFSTGSTERMRIDSSGNVLVTSAAGLGYGTGSGGTVTQATSKSTAVTLNKPTGQITMNNAALAANTTVTFQLTNSVAATTDGIVLTFFNGGVGTSANYLIWGAAQSGSVIINVRNISGGSLSEAIVINFAIIKGVTS